MHCRNACRASKRRMHLCRCIQALNASSGLLAVIFRVAGASVSWQWQMITRGDCSAEAYTCDSHPPGSSALVTENGLPHEQFRH